MASGCATSWPRWTLGWKAQAKRARMADLHPILTKRAQIRDILGFSAYEQ